VPLRRRLAADPVGGRAVCHPGLVLGSPLFYPD